MTIRKATIDDITAIRAMAEVVFCRTYAETLSPEQMEYMMEWMYSAESLKEQNPGGCRVELNVNRSNKAVGFYERMGMRRDREGDFPIGNGYYMNDYIYEIEL